MPTGQESRRIRWVIMLATWAVAGVLIFVQTAAVREYVDLLDAQGLRGASRAGTPLRQVIPARHADAQMWVRHLVDGETDAAGRVRFTRIDNAPAGREVHWSSAFAWLLRGAAGVQRALATTSAGQEPIERALLWFNAPLFLGLIILASAWAARRSGTWAGVLLAFALLGHQRFREVLAPTYVDHHGLANGAILGLVLGAAYMGFGWWMPAPAGGATLLPPDRRHARRAAVISALSGAAAMWLSASSTVWVIGLIGLGGITVALSRGRHAVSAGARFEPEVWRSWGRTGAVASLACYAIEYAPFNLGWRLEVNHPLYALAWWGGAELVAALGTRWLGEARDARAARFRFTQLLLPLVAVLAPLLAIVMGGSATFLPRDPFVAELRHLVAESRSLTATARAYGFGAIAYDLVSVLVVFPAILLLRRRRDDTGIVLAALTVVTVALIVAGCLVVRWWGVVSVAQITLLLWIVGAVAGARARAALVAALAGLLFALPVTWEIVRDYRANQRRAVAAIDLYQPLYRDLAATLRASQPDGTIVLLASPNASAGISYFGRFQSVGTLFWENAPGLRAAAEILCAETDEQAWALVRARGVTHVVMLSAAPFIDEYFALLHPDRPIEESKRTFGFRLMSNPAAGPRWLQPIPYRRPDELAAVGGAISVFQIAPEQTEDVRLFQLGVAHAARGETAAAEAAFLSALPFVPRNSQASLCGFAGESAYEQGAHALAVRMLRRATAAGSGADVASLTAWILATSTDAAVRDGVEALALIQPVVRRNPEDPTALSTLAAAYAELGRFDQAVAAGERALQSMTGTDADTRSLLVRRVEAYRAGRPWRQ